ncbi:MAG TPA: CusA/CzcA family heavy metal efflux RND transporter [Kofleriaceae bacterium]|jgi:cobalt-zinc-cadmium resistance protein CzcA
MLDALLRGSLQSRLAVFLAVITLAIAGWMSYRDLTIEAFPDPTDTQVQVITLYPGQPAEEVERRVSIPLERALNGVPGTMRQRSISLFGLSLVTLTFEDGTDVLSARQQMMERIPDADLPPGVEPDLGPLATPIGEVYRYTLDGASADPMTLRTLQDWVVRPALMRVPGVADITSYGGLVQEVHVEPNPQKMAALGVALDDVFQALGKASLNASGGLVQRGEQGFVIRSVGTFTSQDDIANVRVGFHSGVPVLLKDVAAVVTGYAPRQGVVTRSGSTTNGDAVQGIVLMRKGQNPSVVLAALRDAVDEVQKHGLPAGVTIHAFYDRTELVDTTLDTVFHNLAEGATLVMIVLFVFLMSVRASLVVTIVIPLSLAAAFLYLHARGMSANLLSMGAVDFGIIVDGAVILVEHVFEHVAGPTYQTLSPASRREAVLNAAKQVARPTLFSLLIIVAAYLPIFGLQRVEGRIFGPMAHTVVAALVGAMLVSFTLAPVLCVIALRKHKAIRISPVLKLARKAHDPILRGAMRYPLVVLALTLCMLGFGVELAPRLGSEFLPELNEGSIYVTFTLPPTSSLDEGRALTPKLVALLRKNVPEVTEVLTQLGRPEDGTDAKLFNNLEMFIKLKPMKEWRSNIHTLDDMVAIMTDNLKTVPGIEYNFSQPIRDNVNENISGQQGQVAVKIYGDDVGQLRQIAESASGIIATVPGAADVGIVKASEEPVIAVAPDRKALAHWNLDLGSLQSYLETALSGHAASDYWDGEKKFDVTVRFPKASRENIDSIRDLRVPLQDGSLVPLSALAHVAMATGPAAITREGGKRYIGIRMNVRNRDLGSFIADAQKAVDARVKLPTGYSLTWGGEFENQQRAMKRLGVVLPLSLVLTFFLLFAAFGSVWDAGIILINLPVALLGGLAGLALGGMTLSVSAAVGFIALLGQAVLNGVLVVSSIRARRDAGDDLWTATIEGTRERLRAILMTALLASLGLLPAALSHAIGSETQRPIAMVVVSGTISAALLTLVVLPVSYYWATRLREAIAKRMSAAEPI